MLSPGSKMFFCALCIDGSFTSYCMNKANFHSYNEMKTSVALLLCTMVFASATLNVFQRRLMAPTTCFMADLPTCECTYGYYKDWKNTACIACPAGRHQPFNGTVHGIQDCKLCARGKFNENLGSAACTECPDGSFSHVEGAIHCTPCPVGTYLPSGFHHKTSTNPFEHCLPCDRGTFADTPGTTMCSACAPGQYTNATNTATCPYCPLGKFTGLAGLFTRCMDARQGHYSNDGIEEHPCPIGHISDTIGASECTPCSPGKYYTSNNGCLPCQWGHFQPHAGQSFCDECQAGQYADTLGLMTCKTCLPGQYTPGANSYGHDNATGFRKYCSIAPVGRYAPLGGMTLELCAPGTYNNLTGQTACFDCPMGFYETHYGTSRCVTAHHGWVTTCNGVDCTSRADGIRRCPAGYFHPRGTQRCDGCPRGKYKDVEETTACTLALKGYYVPPDNPVAQLRCSNGTFTANDGSSACTVCPAGRYTKGGGVHTMCHVCVPGRASTKERWHAERCPKCAPGLFQPLFGADTCEECQAGKFVDIYSEQSSCNPAASGYYVPAVRSTEQLSCPPGRYSDQEGASNCTKCEQGKYSPTTTSVSCIFAHPGTIPDEDHINAIICSPGTAAPGIGNHKCHPCEIGKFSNVEGRVKPCDSCEPGSAVNTEGSTACQNCQPGKYAGESGMSTCTLCEPGKTRSLHELELYGDKTKAIAFHKEILRTTCHACQPGRFQKNFGGSDVTCPACPVGTHVDKTGATDCMPCGWSRYTRGEGAVDCKPCLSLTGVWLLPEQCMLVATCVLLTLTTLCGCILWCCKGCPCLMCKSCCRRSRIKLSKDRFAREQDTLKHVVIEADVENDGGQRDLCCVENVRLQQLKLKDPFRRYNKRALKKSKRGVKKNHSENVEKHTAKSSATPLARQSVAMVCMNPLVGRNGSERAAIAERRQISRH